MISVVMATFNGEKNIKEQLLSLKKQTMTIDEVIIFDDKSVDDTVDICERFIFENELSNWKIHCNEKNLGWKMNFRNAIKEASGDIIFLCDQDDIWHLNKIESMMTIMNDKKEILLLASNYTPFYEGSGVKLSLSSDEKNNDNTIEQIAFSEKSFYIRRPGCVYCFRSELIQYFDEYATQDYAHDAFLWRTALMLDGLYIYHNSTIDYRRHSSNATTREKKTIQTKIKTVNAYTEILGSMNKFLNNEKPCNYTNKIIVVDRLLSWNTLRKDLIQNRNYGAWIKLYKYRDCFWKNSTWIADLLMVLGKVYR